MNKESLILKLREIGSIKFGKFTLKSGMTSPFYIDLRNIVSYPKLLEEIVDLLISITNDKQFDVITGIPYTALPIATVLSIKLNKPLIYTRKEEKGYGSKEKIIGNFNPSDTCLVIDDVITTGESKLEITQSLEGVKINDFVVIVDRSINGKEFLKEKGYNLTTILTMNEIIETLHKHGLITEDHKKNAEKFLQKSDSPANLSLKQRALFTKNSLTKKLIDKIIKKQSNLVLSLDVTDRNQFFSILDKVGSEIVMLKSHIDFIEDYSSDFISKLRDYSEKYDFLLFEDRKFADIGSTVRKQYRAGIYHISDWSDFVTVHPLPGEAILEGLFGGLENKSSFLIAAMSAKGNLISDNYTRRAIEIGINNESVVSGFIGFGKDEDEIKKLKNKIPDNFLLLMPGVNLSQQNDNLGQTYLTVEKAIKGGADCIIVGRGIYENSDPEKMAKLYREKSISLLNLS